MVQQKSIFKNLLAKGTLNIFNILVPLLLIPYIYRILTPESIGYIEYGTTLYQYFGLLGLLGIYNYGLREISRFRNNKVKVIEIYKNLFIIGAISNFLFFIIYIFFVYFFIEEIKLRYVMFILSGNLIAQLFYIEWINEAYEDFKFITIKTVIIRVIGVSAIFFLVRSNEDYLNYVIILVLILFFNNITSFIHAQKYVTDTGQSIFKKLNVWHYLVPLFFILILNNTNILYTLADRTMLGLFTTAENVAYYSVGQKIVEVTKTLLLSIVFVTLPRFSFYLEKDKSLYMQNIRKLMRIMLMIVIPVGIGMFMLSKQIVLLFAGNQYLEAIPVLRIFALRIIVLGVESVLYNQIIFLHRKEKILVILNMICGGINVGLNFLFIHHFNPLIAILTTLFAEILFQILCFLYIKKELNISTGFFDRSNLKYLFLSILFIPTIFLINELVGNSYLFVFLSVTICSLIYMGGLCYTKDPEFIAIKNKLLKKAN